MTKRKPTYFLPIVLIIFSSCYKQLKMEGFDKSEWVKYQKECTDYRLTIVDHIIENQSVLLEGNQNNVESLLGKADEHELYNRNQKFFHYKLNPSKECGHYEVDSFLSIRFNAIGRANLIEVTQREKQAKS